MEDRMIRYSDEYIFLSDEQWWIKQLELFPNMTIEDSDLYNQAVNYKRLYKNLLGEYGVALNEINHLNKIIDYALFVGFDIEEVRSILMGKQECINIDLLKELR